MSQRKTESNSRICMDFAITSDIQLWTKLYIRLAISRSKMGLRNWAWQRVKVVSRPWAPRSTLALIRPFKWGTQCIWTPTGSKMTSCQIWTIEKNVRFSTKRMFFSIVQLWRLVILEPVEVQRRCVPHFKGLISAKVNLEAQGCDSNFTFCHAHFKKAIYSY